MKEKLTIKRTDSKNADFQQLLQQLDHELWNELNEDQSLYDQYNKVPGIDTVVVGYAAGSPVSIGCFKKYNDNTVEIKRMYVAKAYRGRGYARLILEELENWSLSRGFSYAILETSIHFKAARNLYEQAGYIVIKNYDQYEGLEESVCMKKELIPAIPPSVFKDLEGVEYFDFEEDFVEQNMRCIPMIVRFKMDAAGIKLKLAEWSKFSKEERIELALKPCTTSQEAKVYNGYLAGLIRKYTDKEATPLVVDQQPEWAEQTKVPTVLEEKMKKLGLALSQDQWKGLTDLQRFALLKLSREGHEHKNFPKAMKEFNLIGSH